MENVYLHVEDNQYGNTNIMLNNSGQNKILDFYVKTDNIIVQ